MVDVELSYRGIEAHVHKRSSSQIDNQNLDLSSRAESAEFTAPLDLLSLDLNSTSQLKARVKIAGTIRTSGHIL